MTKSILAQELLIPVNQNGIVSLFSVDVSEFCSINNIFLCNETQNGANCSIWDMADVYSNEYVGQINVINID
jgi:hypothetical protein